MTELLDEPCSCGVAYGDHDDDTDCEASRFARGIVDRAERKVFNEIIGVIRG